MDANDRAHCEAQNSGLRRLGDAPQGRRGSAGRVRVRALHKLRSACADDAGRRRRALAARQPVLQLELFVIKHVDWCETAGCPHFRLAGELRMAVTGRAACWAGEPVGNGATLSARHCNHVTLSFRVGAAVVKLLAQVALGGAHLVEGRAQVHDAVHHQLGPVFAVQTVQPAV